MWRFEERASESERNVTGREKEREVKLTADWPWSFMQGCKACNLRYLSSLGFYCHLSNNKTKDDGDDAKCVVIFRKKRRQ